MWCRNFANEHTHACTYTQTHTHRHTLIAITTTIINHHDRRNVRLVSVAPSIPEAGRQKERERERESERERQRQRQRQEQRQEQRKQLSCIKVTDTNTPGVWGPS